MSCRSFLAVSLAALAWAPLAAAQTVTQAVDDRHTVELVGNTRPEARFTNDRGALPDDFRLDHLQLQLKRAPQTEAALDRALDAMHDPASPSFHHWLTAEEFGQTYGPAAADIAATTAWLASHGFTIDGVAEGRMVIEFSGTAGQLREAFHTEMHRLSVRGVPHIANMTNPRIPAALSGVVEGIVSLHDFRPHTNFKMRPNYTVNSGGSTYQLVVPADLATIYNFTPLYKEGINGKGETIVVIEDTNVFSTADWTKFRETFGLAYYKTGSFIQIHPAGAAACASPGVVPGNEGEAELDAEWSSSAAPAATIELASCADTVTNFGGLIALQNLVNAKTPPGIVSISYGECEAYNGAAANVAYNAVYQQAVARGMSVFVSSGDEGAASCDANQANAVHGIGVSGFASTPYNVAVGGTDFGDTYASKNSTYWSTKNGGTYGSALSYVPEIPWNDSCAGALLSAYAKYKTPYGSTGFCNSSLGSAYQTTASGSGGPSGCASGAPSVSGVVSGTCKGYPKPSWQAVLGNPADTVRDIPDVSLFAANGVWGHYYAFCDSDVADQGAVCTGAPVNWSGAGGTSFASPILAGIQALVNQKKHGRQGNPNTVYYKLAATEYGTAGNAACNSTTGNKTSAACIFYDVTQGDMDVNCTTTNSCYLPSGTYGVLSTSDSAYKKAYGTTTGWDFATGLGSVNATNIVNNW
jgi:subtilase family serine protease